MFAVSPSQSRGSVSSDSDDEDVEKKKTFWGHVKQFASATKDLAKSKTASGRVDTMQRETVGKIESLLKFFSQLPQMRTSRVDPNKTAAFLMSQKGSPQKKNTSLADAELARQVRVGVKRDEKAELDDSQVLLLRCLRDMMPRVHGRAGESGEKRPEKYYQTLGDLTEHALNQIVEDAYSVGEVVDFLCIGTEIGKILQVESEKLQRVSKQLESPGLSEKKIGRLKASKASLEESVSHLEALLEPVMKRIKIKPSDEGADLRPDPAGMRPSRYISAVTPARKPPQFATSLVSDAKLLEAGDRLFSKALAMNAGTLGGYEHRKMLLTGWLNTVKEIAPDGLGSTEFAVDALAIRMDDRPDGVRSLLESLPAEDLAGIRSSAPSEQGIPSVTREAFMSAAKEAHRKRLCADLRLAVDQVRPAVEEQSLRYKQTFTRTNKPADLVISAAVAYAAVAEHFPGDFSLDAAEEDLRRVVNSSASGWAGLPPEIRDDFYGALKSMDIQLSSSSSTSSSSAGSSPLEGAGAQPADGSTPFRRPQGSTPRKA